VLFRSKNFREQGEDDLAQRAQEQAANLRQREQQATVEAQQQQFLRTWHDNTQRVVKDTPALQDEKNPLSQKVRELLQRDQIYSLVEDGFERAVAHATAELGQATLADKDAQIAKLKAEIKELRKATSISGGPPSGPPSAPKRLEDLPDEQAEERLLAAAAEADNEGGL